MLMKITMIISLVLLTASVATFGQRPSYARQLETQLRCKADPQAAKLMMEMLRSGSLRGPYVVEDSVSYFKLVKPLRVWNFNVVGVFGYQQGYPEFFARGPGTSPPEMIGIVVRGNQNAVKLSLRNRGIDNLEVEPHEYNLNNGNTYARSGLVAIACWAKL